MSSSLRGRRLGLRLLRGIGAALSTPLLPDDYLSLINQRWSARELRGQIVRVVGETENAATLVIKPGWGWHFDHQPGQYLGIGVAVNGRFRWRSYSLTCAPLQHDGLLTITVKAMPEGRLSGHLVRAVAPGTIVRLAPPRGEFVLPHPPPPKLLFITAGSGITPVMAMLRTMGRRDTMPDVMLTHSAPDVDAMLFRAELRGLADRHPGFVLHEQLTRSAGRLSLSADLARVCPDWRQRQTWVCGPNAMLAEAEQVWAAAGLTNCLHLERFGATFSGTPTQGGAVRFTASRRSVQVDGATTLLQAGEQAGIPMPFGCRMGICHTCLVALTEGHARDLRDGTEYRTDHSEAPQKIQTCVTTASGDCVLEL
jgi:ferredoxin-NADP reductase